MASASAHRSERSLAGILCLMGGILVFTMQDVIIKSINGGYAVSQIVFVRCLVAIPLLLIVTHFEGGLRTLWSRQIGLNVLRGAIMFVAYTTYYLALAALPLAETVALGMSSPLFITALSFPLLGEKVGWQRTLAVLVGFAGVLVITRPGHGAFDPAALFALSCALCYGLAQMLARKLGSADSSSVISVYASVTYAVLAGSLGLLLGSGSFAGTGFKSIEFLLRPWVWPPLHDLLLMGLTGAIAALGTYLLAQAYRIAEPGVVAPFEFTGIMWAVLLGYLVWNEVPDQYSWLGIGLIVAAGLFIVYRETVRRRERRALAQQPA